MKKIVKVLTVLLFAASLFVGCDKTTGGGAQNPGGTGGTGGNNVSVTDVEPVTKPEGAKELKFVESDEELMTVFESMANDPVVDALMEKLDGIIGVPQYSNRSARTAYDKVSYADLMKIVMGENGDGKGGYAAQIMDFAAIFEEGGSAKINIDDTFKAIDLKDVLAVVQIPDCLEITDVKAKIVADVTVDGTKEDLDGEDYFVPNEYKADGEVALGGKIGIDPAKLADDTGFGKIKTNIDLRVKLDKVDLSYDFSDEIPTSSGTGSSKINAGLGLGFSYVSPEGLGGRFVASANVSYSMNVSDVNDLGEGSSIEDTITFIKDHATVEVKFNVYDNDGKSTYEKKYGLDEIIELITSMM